MYTWIIFFFILVAIGLICEYLFDFGGAAVFMCFILGILLGWVPAGLFLGDCLAPKEYVEIEKFDLMSFKDNISMTGRFFLLAGNFNNEPSYVYYRKMDDGSSRLESVDADDTYIFEDSELPHIMVFKRKVIPKWKNWVLDIDGKIRREVHVPKGTIRQQFELDTE